LVEIRRMVGRLAPPCLVQLQFPHNHSNILGVPGKPTVRLVAGKADGNTSTMPGALPPMTAVGGCKGGSGQASAIAALAVLLRMNSTGI
jgi:hypothetical protein